MDRAGQYGTNVYVRLHPNATHRHQAQLLLQYDNTNQGYRIDRYQRPYRHTTTDVSQATETLRTRNAAPHQAEVVPADHAGHHVRAVLVPTVLCHHLGPYVPRQRPSLQDTDHRGMD